MLADAKNLNDVLGIIKKIKATASVSTSGKWPAAMILFHCAQSIEYSIDGFPESKHFFVVIIARQIMKKFLKQGFMKHDLAAPVPGASDAPADLDLAAAAARLEAAIKRFQQTKEPLAAHFAYGTVDKPKYELLHTFHIVDHLSEMKLP